MTLSKFTKTFQVFTFLFAAFFMSSCAQHAAIKGDLDKDGVIAEKALRQIEPTKQVSKSLMVDDRPWYGGKAVALAKGDPLPAKFNAKDSVVVTFAEPLTLPQLRSEIQKVTNIRVVFDRGSNTLDQRFLPSDGLQVTGGRVVWQGSLTQLLNQIADAFDVGWSYENGVIKIFQEVTKTFMLHALGTGIDLSGSLETGVSSGGGSLPSVTIDDKTEIKIWDEIEEVLNNILDSRGRISLSRSTGTITVSASPTLVDRVEEYLRQQNALRLRRVAVAVKVLNVQVQNSSEYGFDLFLELQDVIDKQPYQLSSIDGSLSAGILRQSQAINGQIAGTIDDFASIVRAAENVSHVTIANSGSIVTLSDQPAPLQIGRQITYLERISASASGDSTGTSLEPGTIDVGLTMNILPRVIENNRILMRLAISITDAEQPFQTFGTDTQQIQLPQIDTTGFLQNAVLSQGETLVLAGFERRQSGITDARTPSWLLGGTRNYDRGRNITVLLISAEVLPEEPLSVSEQGF